MTSKLRNQLIAFLAVVVILGGGLALDLRNHGKVWNFAWSVTGEEEPIAQMRGVIDWLVSQMRAKPDTRPMVAIDHVTENPYGINAFFWLEADPAKIEDQMRMIADAGFAWVRHQFPWEDIEIDGRGQFTDSRNDIDGDGEPDTIDAFLKYDRIVDLAEKYGLQIQARLDNPPAWSRSRPLEETGAFAPPDDIQDFVNYAVAVAEHYKGRIRYYQVWNEPNIYPEWGNQPVDPEAYTELLCRTYDALKAVDPDIVVISGALAPTVQLDYVALSDFVFLERMYAAGAGECFDILSMQGYGLNSGPTDRRMRTTTVNVGRNQYMRGIMVANGDEHKPIWISEAAWNSVPSEEEHPEPIDARYNFGQVTQEQAARYMPLLYQRAQEEWRWVGVINYWFFTRPSDAESNQSFYYFRMVEPDYQPENDPPFEPLPVYDAMNEFIRRRPYAAILYPGVYQAEHWAIRRPNYAQIIALDDAQFGEAIETTWLSIPLKCAPGDEVIIRWRGESLDIGGNLAFSGLDFDLRHDQDEPHSDPPVERNGWKLTRVTYGLFPACSNSLDIRLLYVSSDTPIIIDSITFIDRTYEVWTYPLLVIGLVGGGMLMLSIVNGMRIRRRRRRAPVKTRIHRRRRVS
jgi:hypothetical protein